MWTGIDATQSQFLARPPLVTTFDGQLPAFAEHEVVKGGTRLLDLQSACPFRAAVELRLGGRPLEDAAAGIAPTERGKVLHDVLEAFWREVRDQATLAAMSPAARADRVRALAVAVLTPLRATADDLRSRLLDLEQGWLESRVLDLMARDLEREPFTVVQTEAECSVDVGGVQVRVKLDRVDRLDDGSHAVIDYKTGANAEAGAWMGERPGVAAAAAVRARRRDGAGDRGGFRRRSQRRHRLRGIARDSAVSRASSRLPAKALVQGVRRLARAAAGVAAPARHARSRARGRGMRGSRRIRRTACKYCHLAALCRYRRDVASKPRRPRIAGDD